MTEAPFARLYYDAVAVIKPPSRLEFPLSDAHGISSTIMGQSVVLKARLLRGRVILRGFLSDYVKAPR